MGVPSVGILLHEMIKLMYHAKCRDPVFIRIGTCGGIGVEGGTVVITEEAVDGLLRNTFEVVNWMQYFTHLFVTLFKLPELILIEFPHIFQFLYARPFHACSQYLENWSSGQQNWIKNWHVNWRVCRIQRSIRMIRLSEKRCALTISTKVNSSNLCFSRLPSHNIIRFNYSTGQGRLDGAFCEFTENDKMEYLNKLHDFGVVNIEMESTIFAALTYHAGIRAAVVCVTLLDRLKGDQVRISKIYWFLKIID